MPTVKTITLSGTETAVTFPQNYPHYMVTNMSSSEMYASGNPGVVPYSDGVYAVPSGTEVRVSPEASGDTLWLLGSGKVQIRGEEIAAPTSFRRFAKGGESGFSGDYSDLTNKPDIPVLSEVINANSTNETAMFYVLVKISFGADARSYGCSARAISTESFDRIEKRLEHVNIENKDFEALIKQYDRPDTLFYCDPPYHNTERHYSEKFSEADHYRLNAL